MLGGISIFDGRPAPVLEGDAGLGTLLRGELGGDASMGLRLECGELGCIAE